MFVRVIATVLYRPFRAHFMVAGFDPGLRFTAPWADICRPFGAVEPAGHRRYEGRATARVGATGLFYGVLFYPIFVRCFYLFGFYFGVPEYYGVTEIQLTGLLEVEGFFVES